MGFSEVRRQNHCLCRPGVYLRRTACHQRLVRTCCPAHCNQAPDDIGTWQLQPVEIRTFHINKPLGHKTSLGLVRMYGASVWFASGTQRRLLRIMTSCTKPAALTWWSLSHSQSTTSHWHAQQLRKPVLTSALWWLSTIPHNSSQKVRRHIDDSADWASCHLLVTLS